MDPTPSLTTGSQPVISPARARVRVPPYFGASAVGVTASCCGGSTVGAAGVVGVVEDAGLVVVGVVEVVGAAACPQPASTRENNIKTVTTRHRSFFIFLPPPYLSYILLYH